jgi:cell wall-associated NlpC family hydrolase
MTQVTRQQVVDEARSWIGTPWQHQQSTKGLGTDCVGFIAGVARETGAVSDVEFQNDYRMNENGAEMVRLFRAYLDPIDWRDARAGDVFVVRFNDDYWHCLIVTSRDDSNLELEFTCIEAGRDGVSEHRIDGSLKRRIHSCYRLRGILD